MTRQEISIELLRSLFSYDSVSGVVSRGADRGTAFKAGDIVGSRSQGYLRVEINGSKFALHRIAWALHHGKWPSNCIDHINGIRDDNRLSNLRDVTNKTNARNRVRAHKQNSSGLRGVHVANKRFRSSICVNGRQIFLGSYPSAEDASAAYEYAKHQYHSDARHE